MIAHPFVGDLSKLTLEEVQEKLGELTKHLNFAYRTQNSGLIHQLHMVYTAYQAAHSQKLQESFDKKNIQAKIDIDQ